MNIVSVEELSKTYRTRIRSGGIVALDGVSLSVMAGEIFGLLGPNGAGKTTLFKVLLGITSSDSGEAHIHGLPPSDPRSRQKAGYLPENHRFPNHLTGLGLLELTGRMYGMTQHETDERAEDLLELVDMDRWANTKISKYSKGMLQRIGLAQALISDPEILFLDEPTDGVDPVGRVEIRGILKRIQSQGKSIFLNSHLLAEVEAVADRVAILSKGRVIRLSSVEALTSRKSQYEIEAKIGHNVIEIPEQVGKVLSVSTQGMIVELSKMENINQIIDRLRMKKIDIYSVKPMKVSLEQSFIEAVTTVEDPQP